MVVAAGVGLLVPEDADLIAHSLQAIDSDRMRALDVERAALAGELLTRAILEGLSEPTSAHGIPEGMEVKVNWMCL